MAVAALQRTGPQVMLGEPRAFFHRQQSCLDTCSWVCWWSSGSRGLLLLLLLLLCSRLLLLGNAC
jgi:hypothetical protein